MTDKTTPQIATVHSALINAGLTNIAGVSEPKQGIHNTGNPATFIGIGDTIFRVDWDAIPPNKDERTAADAIKDLGVGDIKFVLSSVVR